MYFSITNIEYSNVFFSVKNEKFEIHFIANIESVFLINFLTVFTGYHWNPGTPWNGPKKKIMSFIWSHSVNPFPNGPKPPFNLQFSKILSNNFWKNPFRIYPFPDALPDCLGEYRYPMILIKRFMSGWTLWSTTYPWFQVKIFGLRKFMWLEKIFWSFMGFIGRLFC